MQNELFHLFNITQYDSLLIKKQFLYLDNKKKFNLQGELAIVIRELVIKNCGLGRLKADNYTKKMRPPRRVLVNLRGFSVSLKITKKPYFITLNGG